MSTRRAGLALCTLIVAASALLGTVGGAGGSAPVTQATTAGTAPLLTLASQTAWVSAAAPWFNLALNVSDAAGAAGDLHASITFYARVDNDSQLQQAVNGTPTTGALLRMSDVALSDTGGAVGATACVTVVAEPGTSTPATGDGVCAAGSPVLSLGCHPYTGTCGDVYPVSVSLIRNSDSTILGHFTTFLTYQERTAIGPGGPLAWGWSSPHRAVRPGSAPPRAR